MDTETFVKPVQTSSTQPGNFSAPADIDHSMPSASESDHAGVLTDIYQDSFNLAIWRRSLPTPVLSDVETLIITGKSFEIATDVNHLNCIDKIQQESSLFKHSKALNDDISALVDLFCQLLNRQKVRLRLTTVDRVMCPRFHVDNVPCRLVTTYNGPGTQWLCHEAVDRSKLGKGNNGLPDERSGIYRSADDIQQLNNGDVALMKGARWPGNHLTGLVHRSPDPKPGEVRLLLTLDYRS